MQLNFKTSGQGPPIIILHGLFGMLDNWRTIARALEQHYTCILVDLRNHGKSPHAGEMNYHVMAEDILELMNELGHNSTIVMGHSMGGKVAMQFSLLYPHKVNKLIVIDIAPKKYPAHHEHVIDAIQSIDPATLEERSSAEKSFRQYLQDDEATIQFLLKNLARKPKGGFEWKANMPVLIENYEALMEEIGEGAFFNKPTLFVRGEQSDSVRDEDRDQIQKLFPEAQLITIPGAGHWVHADQPGALIDALLAFMQS